MKTLKKLIYICLMFLLLNSCDLLFGKHEKEEPSYNAQVLWKVPITPLSNYEQKILYRNQQIYITTRNEAELCSNNRTSKLYLTIIDITTQTKKNIPLDSAQYGTLFTEMEINNTPYLLIFDKTGKVFIFDMTSNTQKACINLIETNIEEKYRKFITPKFTIATHNKNILWYSEYYAGFVAFNTDLIDWSKSDEIQNIIPKLLVPVDKKYKSHVKPLIKDDIIYYVLEVPYREDAVVVATNLKTKECMWQLEPNDFSGNADHGLMMYKDTLIVADNYGLCFIDYKKGKIKKQMEDLPNGMPFNTAVFCRGITVYDDKLYLTTGLGGTADGRLGLAKGTLKGFMCIDLKDYTYKWGDMPPHSASLNTRPLAYNGKVYVPTDLNGLRMYDAQTGVPLGTDKSLTLFGGRNLILDDIMYFIEDKGEENTMYLVAVKAE